jgi:hypothetical protein
MTHERQLLVSWVRGSCGMWRSETCALFIRGVKITGHMKECLTQQLLDGDMQECLMTKDNSTRQVFDSIQWRSYGAAFKRLPRSWQTVVAKACHNLWHAGENAQSITEARNHVVCAVKHMRIGDTL